MTGREEYRVVRGMRTVGGETAKEGCAFDRTPGMYGTMHGWQAEGSREEAGICLRRIEAPRFPLRFRCRGVTTYPGWKGVVGAKNTKGSLQKAVSRLAGRAT